MSSEERLPGWYDDLRAAGARDLETPEQQWLSRSQVTIAPTLEVGSLPRGPLYLHIDLDVCEPNEIGDLIYPAPRGISFATLLACIARIWATGEVVGIGVAATWRHGGAAGPPASCPAAPTDGSRVVVAAQRNILITVASCSSHETRGLSTLPERRLSRSPKPQLSRRRCVEVFDGTEGDCICGFGGGVGCLGAIGVGVVPGTQRGSGGPDS